MTEPSQIKQPLHIFSLYQIILKTATISPLSPNQTDSFPNFNNALLETLMTDLG